MPLRFIDPYPGQEGSVQLSVTAGVPFPKGALGSTEHLRLVDSQGRELPLQATPLARWQDGSLKWVLVDSQAEAGSSGFLEYGTQVRRRSAATPLRIRETPEQVVVNTGPLEFSVMTRGSGPIDSLRIGGAEMLSANAFYLVSADGTEYSTLAAPEEVIRHIAVPCEGVSVHAVVLGPVDTDMNRGFEIPKASPEAAAAGIFDGLANGEKEIFPDPVP